MLTYAVVCFAVAAAGGLLLAATVLKGRFAVWPISVLHAGLGASGLVLLLIQVVQGAGGSQAAAALALLLVAALGGFYLAALHLRRKIAPKAVVVVHAGVAVAGFLTLLSVLLRS